MHLGMAVLASLRGGHLHNLAWTILAKNMSLIQSPLNHTNTYLDHDKASLPERRTLHGESLGSSRVSLVEVMVLVVRHCDAAVKFSETQVCILTRFQLTLPVNSQTPQNSKVVTEW